MKSFLMSILRAAIFLGFIFLITGCSGGNTRRGRPYANSISRQRFCLYGKRSWKQYFRLRQ